MQQQTLFQVSKKMEKTKKGNLKENILLGKYQMGRLLGQGNFAKVYYAKNLKTGDSVAVKVMDKESITRVGMMEQIKREISIMRLVRHPNIVQLYEVMASKAKIYFVMEYVTGGELFNKVSRGKKLKDDVARKYFQQLISAVDFCHSRGVYHRDLKPENLLIDDDGNLKVSDFGLSALPDQFRQDGLLHTTCGTPAYVAPEVILRKGYDGAKADIWSCGVILFVLLAGYLPFHDANLVLLYKKIYKAEFKLPPWISRDARRIISNILVPNPRTRISIPQIVETPWFRKDFTTAHVRCDDVEKNIDDVDSVFGFKPTCLNAFDIIALSGGLDLSGLFADKAVKRESRFTSKQSASSIMSRLEEIATVLKFRVKRREGTMKMQGSEQGRKGQLAIAAEVFEVAPSLCVVEVKKDGGDTLEYNKFCSQDLRPGLKDIVWAWEGDIHVRT